MAILRASKIKLNCTHCGKGVERLPSQAERVSNVFCDRVCYMAWSKANRAKYLQIYKRGG